MSGVGIIYLLNKKIDNKKLEDIKFIQNKLEEYVTKSGFYPGVTPIYYEEYKKVTMDLYDNSIELQKTASRAEYELFVDSLLSAPPEQILSMNLFDSEIITNDLPVDPKTKNSYTYLFSLQDNNYLVDTYLLSTTLSSYNKALDNDLDGYFESFNCDDPVYCVKNTNSLVSMIGRDQERLNSIYYLNNAIQFYLITATNPSICGGKNFLYSSADLNTNIDGSGWLPIRFNTLSTGISFDELPVDPLNDSESGFVYTYRCDPSNGHYELNAKFETSHFNEYLENDEGNSPDLYEVGNTRLNDLLPFDPVTQAISVEDDKYIEITNIAEGDQLHKGSPFEIKWKNNRDNSNKIVSINLIGPSGNKFGYIDPFTPSAVGAPSPMANDGSIVWMVGSYVGIGDPFSSTVPIDDGYRLEIGLLDEEMYELIVSYQTSSFSIIY